MSAKKGKVASKKGKKKSPDVVAPATDQPPDPVLIAIQTRIAAKYRNLEILHRNVERVIHLTKDKREADAFFRKFRNDLEDEISNDIKPYKARRKQMFQDTKQRFIGDVVKYTEYLAETQDALNARLSSTTSVLSEEYNRLHTTQGTLLSQLTSLRSLQDVKDDQAETIRRLKSELSQLREEQAEEAQRIRLRHARHRLLDLEGRQHRLHTVSEHLAKETLPYFVYRLETKMNENRKLRSTISKRVNDIKYLQKLRSELEAKERTLTFEYEHLLNYKKDTATALKQLPPLKGLKAIQPASGNTRSTADENAAHWNWEPRNINPITTFPYNSAEKDFSRLRFGSLEVIDETVSDPFITDTFLKAVDSLETSSAELMSDFQDM